MQNEIDFLRQQVTQLKDEYSEQLMLQERRHRDEISKYKQLVENANTKLSPVLIFLFFIAYLFIKFIKIFNIIKFVKM